MLVQFTVLQVLDAVDGSLVEIEPVHPDKSAMERLWLWVESHWVTVLTPVNEGNPSLRVFDGAVLKLSGTRGELRWPSGRCSELAVEPSGALRQEFRRLVHQHLN